VSHLIMTVRSRDFDHTERRGKGEVFKEGRIWKQRKKVIVMVGNGTLQRESEVG